MIKVSDEVYKWVEFDLEFDEVILKPYGKYVLTVEAQNLENAILGIDKLKAEIMTLEEWHAQVKNKEITNG